MGLPRRRRRRGAMLRGSQVCSALRRQAALVWPAATRSAALSRSTVFFSFGHFLRPSIYTALQRRTIFAVGFMLQPPLAGGKAAAG
ncbi:hypothetical protein SGRA_1102 [Saprospira grandis str. Lewin]|uniref:Uncharacterized protein n=1 Tax=Saprospira grandis (strain Lewin) TaxID=984262 RepID=H6L3V5_SAPGL|nr:hypothetical protein SGRA_1102 [Saprospira grandis str. Lewin]